MSDGLSIIDKASRVMHFCLKSSKLISQLLGHEANKVINGSIGITCDRCMGFFVPDLMRAVTNFAMSVVMGLRIFNASVREFTAAKAVFKTDFSLSDDEATWHKKFARVPADTFGNSESNSPQKSINLSIILEYVALVDGAKWDINLVAASVDQPCDSSFFCQRFSKQIFSNFGSCMVLLQSVCCKTFPDNSLEVEGGKSITLSVFLSNVVLSTGGQLV